MRPAKKTRKAPASKADVRVITQQPEKAAGPEPNSAAASDTTAVGQSSVSSISYQDKDLLQEASTLSEAIGVAYEQEIESRYRSVIETLSLLLEDQETHKVWMYGPVKMSSHILSILSDRSIRGIETLRKKTVQDTNSMHVLDISTTSTQTTRSVLYRILEKTVSTQARGTKLFFQIPSAADTYKLDKRILSRMEGTKIYLRNFDKDTYFKMFNRVIQRMKEGFKEKDKKQAESTYLGLCPFNVPELPSYDYSRIHKGLLEEIERSHRIDNSFEGMTLRFYRYLYSIVEKSPFSMLNSLHIANIMCSSIKRINFSSAYDEFRRRTTGIPHLRRVSKDSITRRVVDLIESGLIVKGYYTQDRADLEKEVLKREEVFLKVLLERTKRHWRSDIPLPNY